MTNLFLYTMTILIWGSTWFVIKVQLGVADAGVCVLYRFAIASAALLLWCFVRRLSLRFSVRDHLFMILQGLFIFCLNYHLAYVAARHLSSGINAVVFSTVMVFNIINFAIFYKRWITPRTTVGALCGLIGIGAVFYPELSSLELTRNPIVGLMYGMGGALSASFGNIISARHQRLNLPVTQTNAFAMTYGAILTWIYLLFKRANMAFETSVSFIGCLLYLSLFGTIVVFGCYLKLLGRIGPQRSAYALILSPIVALFVSSRFEKFIWSTHAILGTCLILVGNGLVLFGKRPAASEPART